MDKHRHSIRLKNHDYSQSCIYFVTICIKNHSCLFGNINGEKMILNEAGKMIEKWYFELQNKFHDIRCDEYVIMPNHIHAVIVNVGANLCVRPDIVSEQNIVGKQKQFNDLSKNNIINVQSQLNINNCRNINTKYNRGLLQREGEHIGSPLQYVMQWFKTMTTNEYIRGVKQHNWRRFTGKLWQRGYYEHIIRNNNELNNIREYIKNNPLNFV